MNSLMGNNQAMSTPNKKRSLRVFFSPPFSCSASLCEQLLAGGSGETPAYSLLFKVNYRDDERRGLDVGVTPATLVREVVAGTPSIMGG